MTMTAGTRRFRSGTVALGAMGTLAAMLSSCASEPDKRCVERDTYKVIKEDSCRGSSAAGRYYYGGSVSKGKATDGSFDKSAVSKGGFGRGGSGGG